MVVTSRKQIRQSSSFDVAPYLVCCEPKIWVFDDLLPKSFLDDMDKIFDSGDIATTDVPDQQDHLNSVRMITLERGRVDSTTTLIETLAKISHITEFEKCRKIVVSEMWGEDQHCHIDHAHFDKLAPDFQKLNFLDLDRFDRFPLDQNKVVPTFSFVVNMNDVGGIVFPKAQLVDKTIPAKRGRIVMFQNYIESQRPKKNPLCLHYGTYFAKKSKRIITAGVLSNNTPDLSGSVPEPGIIYVLNWQTSHHAPSNTSQARPKKIDRKPRPKFKLENKVLIKESGLDGIVISSNAKDIDWRNGKPVKLVKYTVKFSPNYVNAWLGKKLKKNKWVEIRNLKASELMMSCGNLYVDQIVFLILTDIIGLPIEFSRGWICQCHLCEELLRLKTMRLSKEGSERVAAVKLQRNHITNMWNKEKEESFKVKSGSGKIGSLSSSFERL